MKQTKIKLAIKYSMAICAIIIAVLCVGVFSANAQIVINEIMYDLPGSDTDGEWVEIFNNSDAAVDLTGWKFNDGSNHILNIPPLNGGQGSIIIGPKNYAIISDNAPVFISEHPGFGAAVIDSSFSLKNTSSTLKIINKEGMIIDSIFYDSSLGANGNDKTLERQLDGSFKESAILGGTPGIENSVFIFSPLLSPSPAITSSPTPLPSVSPLPTPTSTSIIVLSPTPLPIQESTASLSDNFYPYVIISEFMPAPDGPDEENEWIEIYNEGDKKINLKNWRIKDASGKEFIFKEDNFIAAKEYAVFKRGLTKITINNDAEILYLIDPEGRDIFKISFSGLAPNNMSFARFGEKKWDWTSKPTPGEENVLAALSSTPKPAGGAAEKINKKQSETVIDLTDKETADKINENGSKENFSIANLIGIGLFISVVFAVLAAIFIKKIGF